ncbi:hypothetical protein BC332_17965 [Capsicum chinense]|nr:hypothetical protein BC332_17965 [Capsicum chinense]
MKKLSFLLLPILLLVIISHVHSQLPSRAPVNWYVLQWPPTYCIQLNNEIPPGRCIEPILEHNFTLHGLWPADANGYTISCTDSVTVNWNQLIPPIESELNKFWPNLREGLPKWSLWKNEYNRHGVCGGLTAKEYFDAAISINKKITLGNLFNYLKTNGIIACDSLAFTKDQIITAVQKVFSSPLHVYLRCPSTGKNATHGYLNEVVLCTDLVKGQYNFISCPQPATPQTCDKFQLLMLPHPQPQSTKAAQRFEEEIDETSPELEQSWAKYAFSI